MSEFYNLKNHKITDFSLNFFATFCFRFRDLLSRFLDEVEKLLLLRRTSLSFSWWETLKLWETFSTSFLPNYCDVSKLTKQLTFGQSIYYKQFTLKVLMKKLIMLMEHFQLLRTSKKNLFNRKKENSVCMLPQTWKSEKKN